MGMIIYSKYTILSSVISCLTNIWLFLMIEFILVQFLNKSMNVIFISQKNKYEINMLDVSSNLADTVLIISLCPRFKVHA